MRKTQAQRIATHTKRYGKNSPLPARKGKNIVDRKDQMTALKRIGKSNFK